MNNRTFCLLLASVLMIMGAIASQLMKSDKDQATELAALAPSDVKDEKWSLPVSGQVCVPFGAEYSEAYGQWMFREYMTVQTGEDENVYAPIRGTVEGVEKTEEGICLTVVNGEEKIRMWPVSGVRIFEGSCVEKGMIMATAGERLSLSVEKNKKAIDPSELFSADNEN